jgi:uncharacterized protein with GYD domain
MAKFLFTGSYTSEGARGVLGEGGSRRREVAEQIITSLGGTVEAYYFGFGSDDFYLIADLPDNAAAAAGAMTASASGAMRIRTTVLLTPEDLDAASKLKPSFRAPGA